MLKNRLRILEVNTGRIWSGAEEHMESIGQGMKKKGHRVYFACPSKREVALNLKQRKQKIIDLTSGIAGIPALIKIIKKLQIDIIQAHSGKDFTFCFLAAKLAGRGKVVFTRHIIKPLKQNIWNSWILKKVDKIIAVSEAVKESLVKFNGVDPRKITVIHNGIDLKKNHWVEKENILAAEYGLKEAEIALCCIGRLDPEKGQRNLIQALPLVLARYPTVKLFLVGEDKKDGQEKKYLEKLSQENNLSHQVIFMGFQANTAQILADSDLFVLPSQAEPFGLVVLEAMAQKTPIVAHSTGGVKEIVQSDVTGILTPTNEPPDLAEGIIKVLSDKQQATIRAEKAYTVLLENFILEKMLDKTENLYYSLKS